MSPNGRYPSWKVPTSEEQIPSWLRTKSMSDEQECDHYWIVRCLNNGEPDWRVGVHGIRTPAVHATCQKCNARTYFTEEQLAAIPIRSKP